MKPDLTLDAEVDPIDIGDVPGGMRADLRYTDGSLTIHSKDGDKNNQTGKIIAGHDWILVRGDGLAIFDGRVTISFGELYPAIARIEGRVQPPEDGSKPQLSFARRARRLSVGAAVPFEVFLQFTVDSSEGCSKAIRQLEKNTYLGFGTYTFGDGSDGINICAYSTRTLRATLDLSVAALTT